MNESKFVSRREAQHRLSEILRNPKLDTDSMLKVMKLYSTISEWDVEEEPASPEQSLEQMVAAVEKKRKLVS